MHVRDAGRQDAAAIAEIYRVHVEESVASFEAAGPGAQQLEARMLAEPRLPWLVAEDASSEVVGFAYASRHRERAAYRWSVDTSVYLRRDATRRGTGRLLYSRLIPTLRDLGYWRAHAAIALPNPGSVALHESFGFRPVGVYRQVGWKLGAWHDVGWWQLALRADADGEHAPPEPRAWQPDEEP